MPTVADKGLTCSFGAVEASGAQYSDNGRRWCGTGRAIVASRALLARACRSGEAALVGRCHSDGLYKREGGSGENKRED